MAYETTNVAVEKSQSEIRKLLIGFGATEFQFGEGTETDHRWSGVSFSHEGHMVMMQVPLKMPDNTQFKSMEAKARRAHTRTLTDIEREYWEQEARRIWRVLFWSLKARVIAIEEGVEEFEQAFLAHLVDPATGMTLWQYVQPAIARGDFQLGGKGLKALESGVSSS